MLRNDDLGLDLKHWGRQKLPALTLLAATALFLTGCVPAPSLTPSASKSAIPTTASLTPEQAKAAYKAIAQASCLAAQNTGEVDENDTVLKVMVAKAQAYKDYSAAYLDKPKTYGVIWEIDAFAGCADWFTFSMAAEAGTEAAIDVTFDAADGSFTAAQDLGKLGLSKWKYGVSNGQIDSALDLNDSQATRYQVTYGVPDLASLDVLHKAVDDYISSLR